MPGAGLGGIRATDGGARPSSGSLKLELASGGRRVAAGLDWLRRLFSWLHVVLCGYGAHHFPFGKAYVPGALLVKSEPAAVVASPTIVPSCVRSALYVVHGRVRTELSVYRRGLVRVQGKERRRRKTGLAYFRTEPFPPPKIDVY